MKTYGIPFVYGIPKDQKEIVNRPPGILVIRYAPAKPAMAYVRNGNKLTKHRIEILPDGRWKLREILYQRTIRGNSIETGIK